MAVEMPFYGNIDIDININNHIEVNLEPLDDMVCGPTTPPTKSMQFIRQQMK
jgi:hypothetical protein